VGFIEIISIVVFPISLWSFLLALEQKRAPLISRIGMFRGEDFINIVFPPSLILMAASGIILSIYSWVLLTGLFVGTAITFQWLGRSLLIRFWAVPYKIIEDWARKERDEDE